MKQLIFLLLLLTNFAFAAKYHYSLFKKDGAKGGNTLLLIGGIHGNEPGGYFAPLIVLRHYKVNSGNLWVVPNLNFDSIIKNERGVYGDMNRKFAAIKPNDKDFLIVSETKELILNPKVDLVLNLHDGFGFYRQQQINSVFNPKAWGQTCVIDQKALAGVKFGNLEEIAKKVNNHANVCLQEDVHEFNVRNTETKDKDEAMRQSLTYFAIMHNKPGFAIETSKNIQDLATKVFYQLQTLEAFMKIADINFTRDFELTIENIRPLLKDYGMLYIDGHIALPLTELSSSINLMPINKKGLSYKSDNPLVALVEDKNKITVMNGNIKVGTIGTTTYELDDSLKSVTVKLDNKEMKSELGKVVKAKESFAIISPDGYRANIIGWSKKGVTNESGYSVKLADMDKKYAIDKNAHTFRAEIYKGKAFCGTVTFEFEK